MKIIPAVDILEGRCVRLRQGQFDRVTRYDADPVELTRAWARAGGRLLHVVDLEGSRSGKPVQGPLVRRLIRRAGMDVQLAGGIRDARLARRAFDAGAAAVVVGSLAVLNPGAMRKLLERFGPDRIVLAADVRGAASTRPRVHISGWTKSAGVGLFELISRYVPDGLARVLCTDIERDGTGRGPSLKLYARLARRFPSLEFQASGGVGSLADLRALSNAGVSAAIVGRALLDEKFTFAQALRCCAAGNATKRMCGDADAAPYCAPSRNALERIC